jgi:hypothetical protein
VLIDSTRACTHARPHVHTHPCTCTTRGCRRTRIPPFNRHSYEFHESEKSRWVRYAPHAESAIEAERANDPSATIVVNMAQSPAPQMLYTINLRHGTQQKQSTGFTRELRRRRTAVQWELCKPLRHTHTPFPFPFSFPLSLPCTPGYTFSLQQLALRRPLCGALTLRLCLFNVRASGHRGFVAGKAGAWIPCQVRINARLELEFTMAQKTGGNPFAVQKAEGILCVDLAKMEITCCISGVVDKIRRVPEKASAYP